jgi:hypothetical protein
MSFQRVHQASPQKTRTRQNTSWLAPRPLTVQAEQDSDRPPTHLAGSWAQSQEQVARFGHNFANIPVHPPDTQVSAPVQRKQMTGDHVLSSTEQHSNQTGLPDRLKAGIENLSGLAMDDVRVHYRSPKPARLQALAYTQGTDIHVAPGRVQPTMQMKDEMPVHDDEGLEREADVMGARASAPAAQLKGGPEEEELLRGNFAPAQLQGDLEEEELLQGKFATHVLPTQFQTTSAPGENRTGMPDPLKAGLEQLSGARVHYNSAKPVQLNALAYTQGQDIEVGPGQERHLPHEGWHLVQQMEGRVKPRMQARGVGINDDPALEREADMMGARAVSQKSPAPHGKFATNEEGLKSLSVGTEALRGKAHQSPHLLQLQEAQETANRHTPKVADAHPGSEDLATPQFIEGVAPEEQEPDSSEPGFDDDEKDLPAGTRKKLAHSWVRQQVKLHHPDPSGLKSILEDAQDRFALSDVRVQQNGERNLQIGYFSSPGDWYSLILNKPIGNNASDLVLGLGGRMYSALVGNRTESGKAKPIYGPLTGRGMGTFMQINGLTKANMPQGSATDSAELEDSNSTYKTLKLRRLSEGGTTYYVAGHLLRGKLGGSGSDWANLSPITQSTNNYASASHLHQVEDEVLALVGTTPITYRVQAIYGRWPWEWPSYFSHLIRYGGTEELNAVMAAEDHIPTGFSCQWWVQGGAGSWIPYSRLIRQWRFSNGESYIVKTAKGDVDFGDKTEVWDYLQIPVKIAIGALLWSMFPMLPALLTSPHLLRGLAANALTDYLGRALDFVNSKVGGTAIAARRAEIGAVTFAASYFGVPQVALLDPLITLAVGDLSKVAIDNGFDKEAISKKVAESTSRIPGLTEWMKDPQTLRGVVAGVIDLGDNPAVRHGIEKTVGMVTNRCTAQTGSGKRCKNFACDAAKRKGQKLCIVHFKP